MSTCTNFILAMAVPDWLHQDIASLGITMLSAVIVYCTMILYTRLNGLRTFAKMNSFDFAITIAIGSILASTLLSKTTPVSTGMVALAVIILLQRLVAYARSRSETLENILTNTPVLIMRGEVILHENLRKNNMSEDDLIAKLREANVLRYSDVHAVVLETTGDVSVLHKASDDQHMEERLLQGVSEY